MSSSETTPVQQSAPPTPQSSTTPAPSESKQPPVKEIPPFEKSIADKIESQFGSKVKIDFIKPLRIRIKTSKEDVLQVAKFVRDEMHYDHAESVTGVDFPTEKEIEVVYQIGRAHV